MKKLLVLLALLAAPLIAQEPTITLAGTSYTMQPHPRVFFNPALDARVKYNSALAPKAVSGNPAWVGLTTRAAAALASYGNPASSHNHDSSYTDGSVVALYAQIYYSDNTQTTYQTDALYLLNNMQQYVTPLCNEGVKDCVTGGNGYWNGSYGPAYYMPNWIYAYELMRPSMTTLQRQTFADKWLNDLAAWGGVDGSASTSCTNPTLVGTISVSINSSGVVTASSPYFGSGQTLQVGDWIYESGNDIGAVIASVSSSTSATIESDVSMSGYSGTLITRRGGWSAGDCGWFWLAKHDWFTPASIIGSSSYPSGGQNGGVDGTGNDNLILSATFGIMSGFMSLADDDVNFSARTQVGANALYTYWHTTTWLGLNEYNYTGFTPTGSVYGIWRAMSMFPLTAYGVVNSLVSPPPLMGGLWASNFAKHSYMSTFPSCPAEEPEYGQSFSQDSSYNSYLPNGFFVPALITIFQSQPEGQYLNYWAQNLWQTCPNGNYSGNTPGTNLMWNATTLATNQFGGTYQHWAYLYMDSAYASNSALPTGAVDRCADLGCSGQVSTSTALPMAGMISRTGYSSITDTLVNFYQLSANEEDHTIPPNGDGQPGDVRIWKGGALLGDDNSNQTWNNGGPSASDVSIGSDADFPTVPYTGLMPAGANDASNRYTYALTDSTGSYKSGAGVLGALRYLVHFKKPGTQDFVIEYDYDKTTAAQPMIAYWQFAQPTHTTLTCPSVTASFPGTGHSDSTQLLAKFLFPAGPNSNFCYVNNTNGSYTGGSGNTFRISVCNSTSGSACANGTVGEFATVFEPVAGAGNTMPAAETIATIDGNHRGIEVDGSSPKVFIVPIGISEPTFTSVTYTSAVPGTAQHLVAGLTAGTYTVTVAGTTVLSGAPVVAGNNSLYFEAGPGAVVISSGGSPMFTLTSSTSGTGTGTMVCTPNGSLAPSTPYSCTATPTGGSTFTSFSASTCTGTASGTNYSGTLTATCNVNAQFTASAALSLSASTCAGTKTGTQLLTFAGCGIQAAGGSPPYVYSWSHSSSFASLPEGLTVNASTGAIGGTIYGQGTYLTQMVVTDQASNTATASVTFSIAGNNTLGGCSLFPSTSAFHINVTSLPVDTSVAAPLNSGYLSSTIKPFFGNAASGNQPNGIPFLVVPYTQALVPVSTTLYQSYFTSGPFPSYSPIEQTANAAANGSDNHVLVIQQPAPGAQCQLWEQWQGIPPYFSGASGGAWSDSSNAYWPNIGATGTNAYAMLPQGNGSTDAAGLPIAPLIVNADEVIGTGTPTAPNGSVQHPIRFTVQHTLARYVWPATASAGTGSCSGGFAGTGGSAKMILQGSGAPTTCTGNTGPTGEIYRLKSSVATPSCASTSPQAAIIIAGFRNFGIILADNGSTGGLIGTPDSRWNDSDLDCLSSLTLGNFEPVNVSSVAAVTTPNYQGTAFSAPVTSYQTSSGTPTFAFTTTIAGTGSGTLTGALCTPGSYQAGINISCSATPAAGSALASLTSTCGWTASGATIGGAMPANTCGVTVTFSLITLSSIAISPTSASVQVGHTQQYAATCTYSNSTTANCTSTATWASSTTAAATINSAGLATAVAAGSSNITASLSGKTSNLSPITVTAVPTFTLSVATAGAGTGTVSGTNCPGSLTAGTNAICTATAAAGSTFAGFTSNCGGSASGNSYSLTMPASNCIVTATFNLIPTQYTLTTSITGTGTGTITGSSCLGTWPIGHALSCGATAGSTSVLSSFSGCGLTGTNPLTGGMPANNCVLSAVFNLATVTAITVTPTASVVYPGRTYPFSATCTYSNGSTANCTSSVTWTSSNTAVATVSTVGVATALSIGQTTIEASVGGINGTALFYVADLNFQLADIGPLSDIYFQ